MHLSPRYFYIEHKLCFDRPRSIFPSFSSARLKSITSSQTKPKTKPENQWQWERQIWSKPALRRPSSFGCKRVPAACQGHFQDTFPPVTPLTWWINLCGWCRLGCVVFLAGWIWWRNSWMADGQMDYEYYKVTRSSPLRSGVLGKKQNSDYSQIFLGNHKNSRYW